MSHGASSPSRILRRRAFLAQRGYDTPAPEREVVHETGLDGVSCQRCGAQLCRPGFSYPPRSHVTLFEGDPTSSWLTSWPPSCALRWREGDA